VIRFADVHRDCAQSQFAAHGAPAGELPGRPQGHEATLLNLSAWPPGLVDGLGSLLKVADGGGLQLSLFDERNMAEISASDYPGQRGCAAGALGRRVAQLARRLTTRYIRLDYSPALLESSAGRI
jgi:hypothetical protein